jgi:hypothetical protein
LTIFQHSNILFSLLLFFRFLLNIFFDIYIFLYFLFFLWKPKKWITTDAPSLQCLRSKNIINALHSKLVKKERKNDLIILGDLPLLKKNDLYSGATSPHTHTVYFMGDQPSNSHWSIFTGDLPTHVHPGLFSGATDPHGLFSWATCPSTHSDLFSRATSPHMLILVYFQGRPAHMVYFHGRPALPLTLIYFHG